MSIEVDVQGSSAVTSVYVDKSRHSFVALCSKGLYIHIQHWEQNKKKYSAPKELKSAGTIISIVVKEVRGLCGGLLLVGGLLLQQQLSVMLCW